MKKIILLAATAFILLGMWSCKTTEANYRAAYRIAKEKQLDGGDSTVTAGLKSELIPRNMRIDGVTLPVRTEPVITSKGGGADASSLQLYNVAVASFKQFFNAQSMRKRLADLGYSSFVVQNRNVTYYVVAASTRSVDEAALLLEKVKGEKQIVLHAPFPYILRAGQLIR